MRDAADAAEAAAAEGAKMEAKIDSDAESRDMPAPPVAAPAAVVPLLLVLGALGFAEALGDLNFPLLFLGLVALELVLLLGLSLMLSLVVAVVVSPTLEMLLLITLLALAMVWVSFRLACVLLPPRG